MKRQYTIEELKELEKKYLLYLLESERTSNKEFLGFIYWLEENEPISQDTTEEIEEIDTIGTLNATTINKVIRSHNSLIKRLQELEKKQMDNKNPRGYCPEWRIKHDTI